MLCCVEICGIILIKYNLGTDAMQSSRKSEGSFLSGEQLYSVIVGDGNGDADTVVGHMLTYLGFKSKLVGTRYLKSAILYRYQKADVARVSLTGDVYRTVAENNCSTVNRVERAIRNSITDCNDNGNLIAFNELVHSKVVEPKFAPTNGELISSIVNWLQLEKQKGNLQ